MRLATYRKGDGSSIAVVSEDAIVDIPTTYAGLPNSSRVAGLASLPSGMRRFLELGEPGLEAARLVEKAMLQGSVVATPLSEAQLLAPIANPDKLFCLGLNYRDHAIESKIEIPTSPVIFSKMSNAIVGPGESVVLPRPEDSKEVDFEAEFVIVIGRKGRFIKPEEAMQYVAGYTMLNDVSARDVQFAESQWLRAKSFDTFAPMGPWITVRDDSVDPNNLDIKFYLNGELMQSSNTKHLIFDVAFIVEFLSRTFTLLPGDIISTGTPSGVGFARKPPVWLKAGDEMKVEISQLGSLINPVVAG